MTMMTITSRNNPLIKEIRALRERKARKGSGLHFIESDKLVSEALSSGARVSTLFVREDAPVPSGVPEEKCVRVSASVMDALCLSDTPQSVCAAVQTPEEGTLSQAQGLVVLLERVQDPGNVGTVIRSADAFGASLIVYSPDTADPFSPKAIRASMGSVYHVPLLCADVPEAVCALKNAGFSCFCGHLKGTETMPEHGRNTAFVVGNEGNGITEKTASLCTKYRLPMPGRAESLNAAAFASVMLYILSEKH